MQVKENTTVTSTLTTVLFRDNPIYERLVFITLLIIIIIPIVYFKYFPNWDGPAHIATAAIIVNYNDATLPIYQKYFILNSFPSPNLTSHMILIGLIKIVPPIQAEKILVIFILVLLLVSFRYFIKSINPNTHYLSYFAFPFALNWFIHAGQYNFYIGLSLFFITTGYWIRYSDHLTFFRAVVLSCLLVLTYLSHIVAILLCLIFIFGILLRDVISDIWLKAKLTNTWRDYFFQVIWYRALGTLLASLPAFVLLGAYILRTISTPPNRYSIPKLILSLLTLSPAIISFDNREIIFSTVISISLLCMAAYFFLKHRDLKLSPERKSWDILLLLIILVIILYFVLPDAANGGSYLTPRLSMFPYFLLLLWISQFDLSRSGRIAVAIFPAIAALGLTVLHFPKYASFNIDMEEYQSAASVLPANSTILPLFYMNEHDGLGGTAVSDNTRPLDTSTGYFVAECGVVDLAHYESAFNYFPTQFREELDPYHFIGSGPDWQQTIPPDVDFQSYSAETPGTVDYVLVWGIDAMANAIRAHPNTQSVLTQLKANYTLIFTSMPRGLMKVYARTEMNNAGVENRCRNIRN